MLNPTHAMAALEGLALSAFPCRQPCSHSATLPWHIQPLLMQATDFSALLRVMEKDLLMLEKHMEGNNIAPATCGPNICMHASKASRLLP